MSIEAVNEVNMPKVKNDNVTPMMDIIPYGTEYLIAVEKLFRLHKTRRRVLVNQAIEELRECLGEVARHGQSTDLAFTFLYSWYVLRKWYEKNRSAYAASNYRTEGNSRYSEANRIDEERRNRHNRSSRSKIERELLFGYLAHCEQEKVSVQYFAPIHLSFRFAQGEHDPLSKRILADEANGEVYDQGEYDLIKDDIIKDDLRELVKSLSERTYRSVSSIMKSEKLTKKEALRRCLQDGYQFLSKLHEIRISL